jgi:ATP phosphoribosyltransferase regulatory subunit
MSKFEEYDLYARNKDFLISDRVITFLDTNGKLMALKPDVTLSIVKNTRDDELGLKKLYYNENVYRASNDSHSFKEIPQVGLECLGELDSYSICEVLELAAKSLLCISTEGILDVSHLGLVSELMDAIGVPGGRKNDLLKCIGEKNTHEMLALCRSCGIENEKIQLLKQVLAANGKPEVVIPKLRDLLDGTIELQALEELEQITAALAGTAAGALLRIDFSAVDDMRYYNGIVFKGYVPSLPSSILSGGQYDKLMKKMGRKSGAIGFAVYLDMLERMDQSRRAYDVDVLLVYEPGTSLCAIRSAAEQLKAEGASVIVQKNVPNDLRYRKLMKLRGEEVVILE